MPSAEAGYRNLILNQRIDPTAMFVSRSVWQSNGKAPRPLKGRKVFGALYGPWIVVADPIGTGANPNVAAAGELSGRPCT